MAPRMWRLLGRWFVFSVLLSVYVAVLFAIGSVSPYLFLTAFIVWGLVKMPFESSQIEADIERFSRGAQTISRRLLHMLFQPLINQR